jgi:hypothetical protein
MYFDGLLFAFICLLSCIVVSPLKLTHPSPIMKLKVTGQVSGTFSQFPLSDPLPLVKSALFHHIRAPGSRKENENRTMNISHPTTQDNHLYCVYRYSVCHQVMANRGTENPNVQHLTY